MTDAWLSMAGATSKGLPNGPPIDEWGIRMEEGSCNPEGASVSRGGGGTNSPASVYAIRKRDEWLRKYAPPGAADLDFYQSLPALNQGNVAQQIFWYTAFTADMVKPKSAGNNTVNSGAFTPEQAMNRLAAEMDQIMARMQAADEKAKTYGGCGPRLNPEKDPSEWLGKPDGPKAKLANEKPQGETVAYKELIKRWTAAK
jgi:hypothetical protein